MSNSQLLMIEESAQALRKKRTDFEEPILLASFGYTGLHKQGTDICSTALSIEWWHNNSKAEIDKLDVC